MRQSGVSERTQQMADKVAKADQNLAQDVAHGITSLPKAVKALEGKKGKPKKLKPPAPTPPPQPPEPPDDEHDDEESDLQTRFDALQKTADDLLAENNEMGKVFDADDKMAALVAENKTLKAQVDVLKSRIDGLMNEKNEAIRAAKSWQNKHDKLVKAAKKAENAI